MINKGEFKSIEDIERLNIKNGRYFFSKDTMRFFKSRVYPEVFQFTNKEAYFLTSEKFDSESPRLISLRVCNLENGDIDTIGEFQQFKTKKEAIKFLFNHLGFLNSFEELKKEIEEVRSFNNIEGLKAIISKRWYYQLLEALPPYKNENEIGWYLSECITDNLYYYCYAYHGFYFCEIKPNTQIVYN